MNATLIRPTGCKNCRFAVKRPEGQKFECRWGPPTAFPILGGGPNGVTVVATLALFPIVDPDILCGRHERFGAQVEQPPRAPTPHLT